MQKERPILIRFIYSNTLELFALLEKVLSNIKQQEQSCFMPITDLGYIIYLKNYSKLLFWIKKSKLQHYGFDIYQAESSRLKIVSESSQKLIIKQKDQLSATTTHEIPLYQYTQQFEQNSLFLILANYIQKTVKQQTVHQLKQQVRQSKLLSRKKSKSEHKELVKIQFDQYSYLILSPNRIKYVQDQITIWQYTKVKSNSNKQLNGLVSFSKEYQRSMTNSLESKISQASIKNKRSVSTILDQHSKKTFNIQSQLKIRQQTLPSIYNKRPQMKFNNNKKLQLQKSSTPKKRSFTQNSQYSNKQLCLENKQLGRSSILKLKTDQTNVSHRNNLWVQSTKTKTMNLNNTQKRKLELQTKCIKKSLLPAIRPKLTLTNDKYRKQLNIQSKMNIQKYCKNAAKMVVKSLKFPVHGLEQLEKQAAAICCQSYILTSQTIKQKKSLIAKLQGYNQSKQLIAAKRPLYRPRDQQDILNEIYQVFQELISNLRKNEILLQSSNSIQQKKHGLTNNLKKINESLRQAKIFQRNLEMSQKQRAIGEIFQLFSSDINRLSDCVTFERKSIYGLEKDKYVLETGLKKLTQILQQPMQKEPDKAEKLLSYLSIFTIQKNTNIKFKGNPEDIFRTIKLKIKDINFLIPLGLFTRVFKDNLSSHFSKVFISKKKTMLIQIQDFSNALETLRENIQEIQDKCTNILLYMNKVMPPFMKFTTQQINHLCDIFAKEVEKYEEIQLTDQLNKYLDINQYLQTDKILANLAETKNYIMIQQQYFNVVNAAPNLITIFKNDDYRNYYLNVSLAKTKLMENIVKNVQNLYKHYETEYSIKKSQLNKRMRFITPKNSIEAIRNFEQCNHKDSNYDEAQQFYVQLCQLTHFLTDRPFTGLTQEQKKNNYIVQMYQSAYEIKKDIKGFLDNYENIMNINLSNYHQVIESLEKEYQFSKQHLRNLTIRMKVLMKKIKNKNDIFQLEEDIRKLQAEYQKYMLNNERLKEQMEIYEMISWEEQEYFKINILILMEVLNFFTLKETKRILHNTIHYLTFQQYKVFVDNYGIFIQKLQEHPFYDLFVKDYQQFKKSSPLAQIFLTKCFTETQIVKILQLGYDIKNTSSMRIHNVLNLNQTISTQNYEQLKKLYIQSKENQFKKLKNQSIQKIQLVFENIKFVGNDGVQIPRTIKKLANEMDILKTIDDYFGDKQEDIQFIGKTINFFKRTYYELFYVKKMVQYNPLLQEKKRTFYQLLDAYENIIQISKKIGKKIIPNITLQIQISQTFKSINSKRQIKSTIEQLSNIFEDFEKRMLRYKEIQIIPYCIDRIRSFHRLCLMSYPQLIESYDWSSIKQVKQNILNMYNQVTDVQILTQKDDYQSDIILQSQKSNQLKQTNTVVLVTKLMLGHQDTISFPQPINITKLLKTNSDILKIITINVQNFLQNTISSSLHRTSQIKLISWFTYFTEQVQYHILMNISLAELTTKIVETQQQISNNLRYDVSHHIMCQITQLGLFRDHLRIFKQFPTQNDFQWISTIKMNEKNKRIIVEQFKNDFVYSFQPKRSIVIHPRMKILVSPNYGDQKLMQQFKISSYILGKPYCHYQDFNDMFLCGKPAKIVQLIQRFQFFISINVQQKNIRLIDNLHKSIFKHSLQHLQNFNNSSSNQRSLKIPIFLNYQNNKIPGLLSHFRNRQNNYLVVNLQLLVITKLQSHSFGFKSRNQSLSNWIKHFPTKIVKLLKAITELLSIGKDTIIATLSDIETNFQQLIQRLLQGQNQQNQHKVSIQPQTQQILANFRQTLTQIISFNVLQKKQTIKLLVQQTLKSQNCYRICQESQSYIQKFIDQWVSQMSIKSNNTNHNVVNEAQMENNIILYGPVSGKTHVINNILKKHKRNEIICCGAARYVKIINEKDKKVKQKIIVETESLGFIAPNIIAKQNLLYFAQKTIEETQALFYDMIAKMKKRNQKKAEKLAHCQFNPVQIMNKAFTANVDKLCYQFFLGHCIAFENTNKSNFQPQSSLRLSMMQQLIKPFEERIVKINKKQVIKEHILTIFNQTIFEIVYYMMQYLDRRKYLEILKSQFLKRKISQLLNIKVDDLTIYTIKDGQVVKLQTMIGRKKIDTDIFDTDFIHMIKNISVQQYYIDNFRLLGISSLVECQSYPYKVLFKKIKTKLADKQLFIPSTQQISEIFNNLPQNCYMIADSASRIFCEKRKQFYNKYSIVFVDDIHLASYENMDLMINYLQRQVSDKILICSGSFQKLSYFRLFRHFFKVILPKLQIESIFKTFTKVGISQELIDAMKKIISNSQLLPDQIDQYKFLFKVCLKLPTQFYKKFFINQLILTKLSIKEGNIPNQLENIFKKLDSIYSMTNKQFFIRRRKGQLNQIVQKQFYFEVDKLINYYCSSKNILQLCYSYIPSEVKIKSGTVFNLINIRRLQEISVAFPLNEHLNRNYFVQILRFCLADSHYIIRQDFNLLPQLISKIQGYDLYKLSVNNFEKDLVSIIKKLNSEDPVVQKTQKKIKSAKIQAKRNYAIVVVPSELAHNLKFLKLLEYCVKKYSIVSFFSEIFKYYNQQKQCKEYISNYLQQAKHVRNSINHTLWNRIKFVVTLNFAESFSKWQNDEINESFIQIDARVPEQDKIKAVDEYLSIFLQKIKTIKKAYDSEFRIVFQAKATNVNEKYFEEFEHYCNVLKNFIKKILAQKCFSLLDIIKGLKKIIVFMQEKIAQFVNFTMALKSSQNKDIRSQFSLQQDEVLEETQKFIGETYYANFSSINLLAYKNYTDYFHKIKQQIQIKRVEYLLIKVLRDDNMDTLTSLRNKIMKYSFSQPSKLLEVPKQIKQRDQAFYNKETVTYNRDKLVFQIQQLNKKLIEFQKTYKTKLQISQLQGQNSQLSLIQMVRQFLQEQEKIKYNQQSEIINFLNSEFGQYFEKRQISITIKKCDFTLMTKIANKCSFVVQQLMNACKQSENQKLDLLYPYLQHILQIQGILKFQEKECINYTLQRQAQLFQYHYTLDLISKNRQIVEYLNQQLTVREHRLKYYQQIYNLYEFFFKSKEKKLIQQYIQGIYYRIIQYFINNLNNNFQQQFPLEQQQEFILQLNQLFQIDNKLNKNFFRKDYLDIEVSHFKKSKVNVLAKENIFCIYDPFFMFKDLYDHKYNKITYDLCIMTNKDLNNLGTSKVNQYVPKPTIYCFYAYDLQKIDKIKAAIQYCLHRIKQKNRDLTECKEKLDNSFQLEKIAIILGKKQYQQYFNKFADTTINFEITYHYFFQDIIMKNAKINVMTNQLHEFMVKYKICQKRCIKIYQDMHQMHESQLIDYFQAFKWQITEFIKCKTILDQSLHLLSQARKQHPAAMVLKAYKALKSKLNQGGIFYKFLKRKINCYQSININETSNILSTNKFLRAKSSYENKVDSIDSQENLSESKSSMNSNMSIKFQGTVSSQLLKILDRIKSGYTIYTLEELKECLSLSNIVCVIYNRFNSKLMKDLHLMEQQGLTDPTYVYEQSSLERLQIEQLMDFVGQGVDFKQLDQQRKLSKKVKIFFVEATFFQEQQNISIKNMQKICRIVQLGQILQI